MSMINLAGIIDDSIVDGPGLRLTVFVQGCDKDCEGCHNQDARPMSGGTPYTPDSLLERIDANPLLSGVTISGGEPMLQAGALLPFALAVKEKGLSLAIYTGDTFEQIMDRGDREQLDLLSLADILIDGPFVLAKKTLSLPFRGSSNQRILDLKKSLSEKRAVVTDDTD